MRRFVVVPKAMMRDARQASGLFFALLAIVAQLTMAAVVPAVAVSLADVAVLCHHDGGSDAPPVPRTRSSDCLLCFFCHTGASPWLSPPRHPSFPSPVPPWSRAP